MRHDATLLTLARSQRGLVTRRQALDAGVSSSALTRRIAAGDLTSVQPGVYLFGGGRLDPHQLAWSATLSAAPDAVASHRSAARLHDLAIRRTTDVDITVPSHRRPSLRSVQVHRSDDLWAQHRAMTADGLPVTTVERTLVDLGDVVPPTAVTRAVEDAVVRRLTTPDRLKSILDEIGRQGRNGRGALRHTLESWLFGDRPPDSTLEVAFARLLDGSALPTPCYQYEIRDGLDLVARVDACWPQQRVIAEVDGLRHHGTADRLQHDLVRQNRLTTLGYTVVRFTWDDVHRHGTRVVGTLTTALLRRKKADPGHFSSGKRVGVGVR